MFSGKFEEENILEQEHGPFRPYTIKKLQAKAMKKQEVYRPQLEDFEDVYSPETIAEDISYVREIEAKMEQKNQELSKEEYARLKEQKEIADITEFIIENQLSGTWLNERAICSPTSHYDDYKNGIDMVAEFPHEQEPNRYIGLDLDITFSRNEEIIEEKLKKIQNRDIQNGTLGSVKYFESDEYKGGLSLPRAIVVLDKEQEVGDLFTKERKQDREGLSADKVQYTILYQLQRQFTAYAKQSEEHGHMHAYESYKQAAEEVTEIINEKMDAFQKHTEYVRKHFGNRVIDSYFEAKEL